MTTAGHSAGAFIRILVYSNLDGVPSSKLIESTSLDCSNSGIKTFNTSYTFNAGTTYWLGYYSNLAMALNIFDVSQMIPISASTHTNSFTTLTVAATFPTAPATLGAATPATAIVNLGVINLQSA